MTQSSASTENAERLNGTVERVTFHNPDNGFCVLKVNVKGHRDCVPVIGNTPNIGPGEFVESLGQWVNDRTHGLQFKASYLKVVQPSTKEGIEKYLASGMVKGIGPHYAKILVKTFGDRVFEVIEDDPNALLKLPGIGKKRMTLITEAWSEQKVIRSIMVFLQSHGVGTARAVRIYKTYGNDAIDRVRENPYRLSTDIHGIGFKTADTIANRLGIPKDSMLRARAGTTFVLQELSNRGDCCVPFDTLVTSAVNLLEIPEKTIQTAIEAEINGEQIREDTREEKRICYAAHLYQSEVGVAQHIKRLQKEKVPWGEIDARKAIPWAERKARVTLSDSQRKGIEVALKAKVMIITGGPGVGKTTMVRTLLNVIRAKCVKVTLCAPTGRAAKRLTQTTGLEAKTIHRTLAFDPQTRAFTHNTFRPLETDFVIVDEASMLDIGLMYHLLKAIPNHAALLLIGDVDQLPSVGPGAVLKNLIEANTIPTITLKEIFRQASHSHIIINAHRINSGEMPFYNTNKEKLSDFYFIPTTDPATIQETIVTLVTSRIPKRFGLDPLTDIQVLTPMNRGALGTRALNECLQSHLNKNATPKVTRFGTVFAPGDKVLQLTNNYDKEVFNGDIGIVDAIDGEEQLLLIRFDERQVTYTYNELDELSLAYATSIHKSQGSEYACVVMPLAMQHYMMLARNLVYTGITRGKKLVIVVGETKALAMAVNNGKTSLRKTYLAERLRESV